MRAMEAGEWWRGDGRWLCCASGSEGGADGGSEELFALCTRPGILGGD